MEENENQKKKKLPTFSIIFFGILAVINVYLFWYHPTGICIFWGILTLLTLWTVKEATDIEFRTPTILIVWKGIQFVLYLIITIAFTIHNHALAIAGLSTIVLSGIISTVFECIKRPAEILGTILCSISVLIGYLIMLISLSNNVPF